MCDSLDFPTSPSPDFTVPRSVSRRKPDDAHQKKRVGVGSFRNHCVCFAFTHLGLPALLSLLPFFHLIHFQCIVNDVVISF